MHEENQGDSGTRAHQECPLVQRAHPPAVIKPAQLACPSSGGAPAAGGTLRSVWPWTPRPLPGKEGACCPVVQDSLWFIPLSPATWWSTLELQGPEWEPETCPCIRPLPPPGSPPTLRINPSPDLMCCPIRALATARPVAHPEEFLVPHTHSRTPALRTGAVSA